MKAILNSGLGRFSVLALVTVFVATSASADRRDLFSGHAGSDAPDLETYAGSLGFSAEDQVKTPEITYHAKGGTVIWDNGDFNGVNGLASEENSLGGLITAWSADDFLLTSARDIDHAHAQMFTLGALNWQVNFFDDAGGIPTNVPLRIDPWTDQMIYGSAFGIVIYEVEFSTPGLNLGPGRFWISPQTVNSTRGFFATSSPSDPQAVAQFKGPFWGYNNWTPATALCNCASFAFELHEPEGGGGGDCDLSPIEAKLDDETRFTDDDELTDLNDGIMSRFDSTDAQLASLETKMDQLQADMDQLKAAVCDVIRLLHTPSGNRTAGPVDACGGQVYDWNHEGTDRRD